MNWLKFVNAISMVESSGDSDAVGDNGQAIGAFQMHPEVLIDVGNIYGTVFQDKDRLNSSISAAVCVLYVSWYAKEERIGHKPTEKDYALCWHYGPSFYKIEDCHGYWDKVQKYI